ncbi:radical SAM protein [Chloroflexota bacterium]
MEPQVIIRPPSEANSYLLPVTYGCSNNTCTFCSSYKEMPFRIRPYEDIAEDIDRVADSYGSQVERVFLENGDAVIAKQELLVAVLKHLREKFSKLERIGTYSTPRAAIVKTLAELKELHDLGLYIAYLGVESGDDGILKAVKKGATHDEIVLAGKKLKEAGIAVSATVILGLGGVEKSRQHAEATARTLTEIDPEFGGALVLTPKFGTPLYEAIQKGEFHQITPMQTLEELCIIIEQSNFTDCFFTSNHASNYLPIRVRLPQQKEETVKAIRDIINREDESMLRPSLYRKLGIL